MMLRTLRILTISISISCGGSIALADCAAIALLDGMHAAENRIVRAGMGPSNDGDIAILQRDFVRIDPDALPEIVGDQNVAVFETFLRQAETFLQLTENTAPTLAHGFLSSTNVVQNASEVAERLHELRCQAPSEPQTQPDPNESGTSLFGVPLNFTLSAARVATVAGCLVGLVGLIVSTMRWRALRQRRAKRHRIHYPTSYRVAGAKFDGDLLDVSGAGTKLRHDPTHPPDLGTKITVQILDQWVAGTIQWTNPNYSGILFSHPMSTRQVNRLVRAPKLTQQQKTAPQGDAV